MTKRTPTPRTCTNGHIYYKSSDCPVCPTCVSEKKADGFLSELPAPARRALTSKGIISVQQLSQLSENEVLAMHGMGKSSIPKLKGSLVSQGLSFKN